MYKGSPARVLEVNVEHRSYTVKRTNADGTAFIGNEINTPFEPNKRLQPLIDPGLGFSSSVNPNVVVSLFVAGVLLGAGACYYMWW